MRNIWNGFVSILTFIGKHFKAMLFLLIVFIIFASTSEPYEEPNLMRIDLTGAIMDATPVLKKIQVAKETDSIKGVLFYVNSPGGSVAPSVELYMAIKDLKKTKKVIAYAAGTMASGSYYAASPSDYIVANPGSMIGSIGVIASVPNIEELAKKIGISEQVVSAGEYKQAGTITRKWTAQERESLQENIDDIYDLFVTDVAEARGLDKKDIKEFANARIFIASKAKNVGLVDSIGGINDALAILMKESNVTDAVWKEPDFADKIAKKFGSEVRSLVVDVFYGVNFY